MAELVRYLREVHSSRGVRLRLPWCQLEAFCKAADFLDAADLKMAIEDEVCSLSDLEVRDCGRNWVVSATFPTLDCGSGTFCCPDV